MFQRKCLKPGENIFSHGHYIWEIPGKILVFFTLSLRLLLFPRLDLKDWSVGMEFHHILLLFNILLLLVSLSKV